MVFPLLFVAGMASSLVLTFWSILNVLLLADLECDFINPIEFCSKLNKYLVFEFLLHAGQTALFVLGLQAKIVLVNAPLLAYDGNRVFRNNFLYDPTKLFQNVEKYKMTRYIKVSFHLLFFFYYFYRFLVAVYG
ncbi:MAG: ER-derived vesicles protein ERV14 [Amphiamblys sp. WSBS2006]|nr:MAG: ER-derived vesicles protein ERV14 [Amphiamblys sp. WSBS2006]